MELILQVLALEPSSQVLSKEPIVPFAILSVVILAVPILFERLRIPRFIGLLTAGIVLGPHGWNLLQADLKIIELMSNIGLVYLMFVVGIEIDITKFRQTKNLSLGFGSFTFAIPLFVGLVIGRFLNLEWSTAILLGSLLASQTLLAYPILNRLGVVNNQAVKVAIGANIVTDISSLFVFAICIAAYTHQLNIFSLLTLFGWLIIYGTTILVGFDWAGKEFFRRSGEDESNQLLFILVVILLAEVGTQILGIQKIIGAFLAGLVVNETLGEGAVKEKVIFVGRILFIPIFFVHLGLILDFPSFIQKFDNLKLVLIISLGLIISKFVAAFLAKIIYQYNWRETITMWSLSLPQVSATVAITFVGYQVGLLSSEVFHSVIAVMVMTSILAPLITSQVAVGLVIPASKLQSQPHPGYATAAVRESNYRILVPISNPQTHQNLIEMAALVAKHRNGKIIPLAIATAAAHMDAPHLEISLQRSERLLTKAAALSQLLEVKSEPLLRIDDAFAQGICHAAREQQANLIIMGWGKRTGIRARLFGNVIDSVLWASHCPVAVTRLVESPSKIQRILVPVENLTSPTLEPVKLAQILAETNQAQVTVLNVCDRRTSSSKIAATRSHLTSIISKLALTNPPDIQIIAHENASQAILQAARLYDLVVLPFTRNRAISDGLGISDVTTQLARQLTCSIIMLGEPQRHQIPSQSPGVVSTTAVIGYQ
ncbi:cation:proton antiporter [Calothrix sp. PCC 6303]|uniref:cation:proton antiporter domain-containing protein n=1 Tax=Calothrix sp. PCC 6303 TaxID=1170562 RepID=UPI0002A05431|nr:cation:proton antiporter [Calothrix sp. PCC 6303]AFZ04483.1 transporter, CPA2 family [Calothrix sp. PCC 6303]